eukprot:scaffold17629_cov34-Tisochrysis_lutea.AAC.6
MGRQRPYCTEPLDLSSISVPMPSQVPTGCRRHLGDAHHAVRLDRLELFLQVGVDHLDKAEVATRAKPEGADEIRPTDCGRR